ncbi:cbb3-type cytochrome c oxidase subunit I [Noviherbaspirillum denitrificans]|uniref:cbb3-type cytochrome c oxidase subunit I n=1 Tax=Noviherbaspirillum denitrificans TaxID=1968433 RepID=UPI000B5354D5|nr:cbb3-type cytochrome c oxidase subunit I [Noviherbaspirillum denitrificans]
MTHYTGIETALHSQPGARRLVGGWLLLALLALAFSTGFAVLLVASRTPISGGFVASVSLFRSALVLHVGLAVVVWFLSCAAALWSMAAGGVPGHTRWAALALAYAGVLGMLGALFSRSPVPVLANYIPVLDSPVFLLGLVSFLGGVALCGATSIGGVLSHVKKNITAWRVAALLSIGVTAIALLALAIPVAQSGVPTHAMQFELWAWGPGHILQFAHVLLLMGVWNVLGEQALVRTVASRSFMAGQLLLAALPVLAAPGVYIAYPIDSPEFRRAFTLLMAWGSWPAPVLLGGCLLVQIVRAGRGVRMALDNLPLVLSIFLFLMGCLCGAAIHGESTMVPAHYHGTVGAVTLAYMALGYRLLPAFGFAQGRGRLERWQPAIYGTGLIILVASLAWSGWLGVPRKSLHGETGMQSLAYFSAMGLVGLGGLLAVSGAALFVFNIVRVLRTERVPTVQVAGDRSIYPANLPVRG